MNIINLLLVPKWKLKRVTQLIRYEFFIEEGGGGGDGRKGANYVLAPLYNLEN